MKVLKFILFLPLLILIFNCNNSKTEQQTTTTETYPGISGELCVSETQYTINLGQGTDAFAISKQEFEKYFAGNIGGQIRTVTTKTISSETGEASILTLWNNGSSIKYSRDNEIIGSINTQIYGLITDLFAYTYNSKFKILFGTNNGFGIIKLNDDGSFSKQFFKNFPKGIYKISSIKKNNLNHFYFITNDGYILSTTDKELEKQNYCFNVISNSSVFTEDDIEYIPEKTALSNNKIFVLANNNPILLTPAPVEATYFIYNSIKTDKPASIIKIIDSETHELQSLEIPLDTKGFSGFDRFIATDIKTDGVNLYVAGIAYDKASLETFLARETLGIISHAQTSTGSDAIAAGFFIFRDLSDLTKADYFATLPLSTFQTTKYTSELTFKFDAINDTTACIKGTNFIAILIKSADEITGDETWNITKAYDIRNGVVAGLPIKVEITSSTNQLFVASTSIALTLTDINSSIQVIAPDLNLYVYDTDAINPKIEGSSSTHIAVVKKQDLGSLYLENLTESITIEKDEDQNIGMSAYDGTNLVFLTEAESSGINLYWQNKEETSTRGHYFVSKDDDTQEFEDFPSSARTVADMELNQNKLFVLYFAHEERNNYYKVAVYGAMTTEEGIYNITLQGLSETVVDETGYYHNKLPEFKLFNYNSATNTHHTVFFSTRGLKFLYITPNDIPGPESPIETLLDNVNILDVDFDNSGNKFAFVQYDGLHIRNYGAPETDIGSFPAGEVVTDASLEFTNNLVFLTAKLEDNTKPFLIIDTSDPANFDTKILCENCGFNSIQILPKLANELLAISDTLGIEIYDISDF